jgi:hypothetical protein
VSRNATVHPTDGDPNRVSRVGDDAAPWVWVGDQSPEILVAGQSHRASLLRAYQLGLTPLRMSVLSGTEGRRAGDIDRS